MVKKLELLVLCGLLGAPCATILSRCAAAPSLFAVHPAANAVAFLLCFPLGIYVVVERKTVTHFKTRVFLSQLHMFSQMLAMLLLSVGGAAAYMTKNAFGPRHHFWRQEDELAMEEPGPPHWRHSGIPGRRFECYPRCIQRKLGHLPVG
ncbi:hypothetical protein, variant [Phytophthora nicotianae CJ01A1]|uniref:Cytochrome b561 domain-containing protein n=1 Tax=Phytophthora nicotianae CJ01A1 TaxID=1317063 RepID=W2XCA1_PHYNI|nr:hypothetical protein, variant [Phytophthora nicotianae CJ01A1]